jgi:ferric-chelate reductase (NADPH)
VLGIPNATLLERAEDDAHLNEAETLIARIAAKRAPEQFIFSGNARSIQHLTRILKRGGISSSRLKVKAYWSPGKTGLD